MKDFWLIDYERAMDEYVAHVLQFGETEARQRFYWNMLALGFDQMEIEGFMGDMTR